MTTLKIRGAKIIFVKDGTSFCFPFVFASDAGGNYTITSATAQFQFTFTEHINSFLDEGGIAAWTDSYDALDEFLGLYSASGSDTNITDAVYSISEEFEKLIVSPGLLQTFHWQDNFQDTKQVSSGKASLLGFRFHNKTASAKTFRFYDVASLPIVAGTIPRYQITIPAGETKYHLFNGHSLAAFGQKMYFTIHNDDVYATNTYTASGTGFTVAIDWKNN